ncbi:MAG: AAA family ATPase [Bryobacterales bacterium]|nr:AAA family ATPase [Bryobacterales bacterium]
MDRHLLPIGIPDFATIRGDSFYYVDKTPLIHQLVKQGRYYFLSRPRRFGKSLLADTLHELFAGNEQLFRGLYIHEFWDWSEANPIVHLCFGGNYNEPGNLASDILAQLRIIERNAGLEVPLQDLTGPERLRNLLDQLHVRSGRRVAVLIDEYDKPILDVLGKPDLAKENRDHLRGLYGIVKDCARHVRFVFVTGVSMFSKVSLFSGLNNLEDISLDPQFATLCGYTDGDLNAVFAPEISGLDRDRIRHWYNGYNWRGEEKVYNPFDILLLFKKREFQPWWFRTGTPDFLYQTMLKRGVSPLDLENRVSDVDLVSTFDVDDIGLDALLFQTGYLTIASEDSRGGETFITLDYPNREIRQSLNKGLLGHLGKPAGEVRAVGESLCRLLAGGDFAGFADRLRSFLAGVPYQWHSKPEIGRYEAWYKGLLYACFRATGADLRLEDASSHGSADMVLLHGERAFVLEFKMARDSEDGDAAAARALVQARERNYAEKYSGLGGSVYLVGLAFGRKERNLLALKTERC